jgi:hypothetical protein
MKRGAETIEQGGDRSAIARAGSRAPIDCCLLRNARREDPIGMLASPVRVRLE